MSYYSRYYNFIDKKWSNWNPSEEYQIIVLNRYIETKDSNIIVEHPFFGTTILVFTLINKSELSTLYRYYIPKYNIMVEMEMK
jgi:hypothetical protein